MQLGIIVTIAVLCSVVVFVAVDRLGKRMGRTNLTYQAPLIAGLIGAVVFFAICFRQLLTPEQMVTVLWINAILPLVGIAICLLRGRSLLRYNIPVTLVIVAVYIIFCTVTMSDFGLSEQMSERLKLGLFGIEYLLWTFPLAAVLIAYKPYRVKQVRQRRLYE